MPKKVVSSDIKIAIVHDAGRIGVEWKKFIEDMFTEDLPEDCRDMGLDVTSEGMEKLSGKAMSHILSCEWRLFIMSQTMLEALQDEDSPLNQSELFETDPDKNIVLVLGDNTTDFVKEVRQALSAFPDFFSFHIIHATSTEKIFSDIIAVVSPLYIVFHPNILSAEDLERQHITLIANKAYPNNNESSHQFYVEFVDGETKNEVEASLFNPCTLLLENPGHAPGIVDVNVYFCPKGNDDKYDKSKRVQVGGPIQVWFQSALDNVHSVLEKSSNPFEFLCQALNLKSLDTDARELVDRALTNSFQKHIPEDQLVRVFGNDQGINTERDEGHRKELAPTLLHFAALHGLRSLTALLLRCPGSIRAFGTANCEGDFPTNLAEKAGHWELKDYMKSYMEVSAMVDYELGNTNQTSHMMSRIVTGNYLSLSEYEPESCYESINSGTKEPPPGYLRMKPLRPPRSEIATYDSPFIIPIPVAEDSSYYETMLTQMLESDDTYMSLNTISEVEEELSFDDQAPPVPRRDFTHRSSADSIRMLEETGGSLSVEPALHPVTRGLGAERTSYESLSMPKMMSYISPAQQELILLQQKVKKGELTTNQAVGRFKEWERKHKEQAASFQFQQECLQRIRQSLTKSKELKRLKGEDASIEITGPITAGSSTYDLVLRKTGGSEPNEACYGAVSKTHSSASLGSLVEETIASQSIRRNSKQDEMSSSHQFDNGFRRQSTRSHRSSSRSSSSSNIGRSYHMDGTMTLPHNMGSTIHAEPPPPVPPRDQALAYHDRPSLPPRSPIVR